MTMHSLLVPIHLDALVLTKPDLLVGPAAHFSRLPHVWKGADVNPDVPNLGKSIVAPPFRDRSFSMDSGVHLHWALPDGLTRAQHPSREQAAMRAGPGSSASDDSLSGGFPAVPNRWLVVRRHENTAGDWPVEAAWVVESDFLWPDDETREDEVSVPSAWTEPDPANPAPRPFRRMGRRLDLDRYPAGLDGGTHLARPLTAMGYGDPTFATVYQNCHSVFGLYDPCVPVVDTRYDVFGWYSDPERDPLRGALAGEPDDSARARAIELLFGWKRADRAAIPAGTEAICFVSMTIPGKRATKPRTGTVELAIGNTATEALSAYLVRDIPDKKARDKQEDQLESMLLASRLSAKQLDRKDRLADARHEKGFVATFGGWIWTVTLQDSPKNSLAEAGTQDEEPAPLDAELALLLAHLNDLQRSHDRKAQDLEAARGQLFADWCKYMHVVYPSDVTWQEHATFDGDEIGVFVAQQADAVERMANDLRNTVLPGIEAAVKDVADRMAELNREREARKAQQFILRRGPGPRFYRPTEPVLLIHGDAVRPTERHGQDGRENPDDMLLCHLSTAALFSAGRVPDPAVLCAEVDRLRKPGPDGAPPADRIGFCTWEQPWHPILLEWDVELTPFARDARGAYPPDHIKSRYSLPINAVALTPGEAAPVHATSRRLTGTSILTPHAREQHEAALTACVVEHCACSHEHLKEHRATMETARRAAQAQPGEDFVCTALCALGEMEGKQFLSQALTGFNDALLGLHQSYQLPVADPIGFDSEQALARRVRDLVLSFNRSAPDDAGHFEPIRMGRLEVKKLRLVDTFGQIQDLRVEHATTAIAAPLCGPGGDVALPLRGPGGDVALPPRFVQPARVNLRWLPAAGPAPAAGPICGWLILDNLDRSLLVHDAAGRALGVISGGSEAGLWEAGWQAAPGNDPGMKVWNIEDPHLRRLATWFVQHARSSDGWEPILKKIETALNNIDPEAATHHEDLAVLMGRPLAVVRAGLSLGLAGPPAIHQGEAALFMDIQTGTRQTDRFEEVTIPVRLGAHERANDGLVAYWRETPKGLRAEAQWPQSDDIDPIFVAPSSELDPVTLTMLVDPLAEVHATSGVLPTKAITLPSGTYAAALKRLEVTFRSLGPILTRVGRLDLPLPIEPGYAWSWIERDDRGWSAVAGDVGAAEDDGAFSGPIVAREGWMRLTKVEPPEPASSDGTDTGTTDVTPRPS